MTIDNELKEINRRLEEIEKKNQKESARSREDYTTKKTKCESAADVAAPRRRTTVALGHGLRAHPRGHPRARRAKGGDVCS